MFGANFDLACWNLIGRASDEPKCFLGNFACLVDGVDDQVHHRIFVGGLPVESLTAEGWRYAARKSPRRRIHSAFGSANDKNFPYRKFGLAHPFSFLNLE